MGEVGLFLSLGFGVGILGGLFGIGGGILIVPILVYALGWPEKVAQGTALAMLLLPVGLLGAWQYYRRKQIQIAAAILMAIMAVPGGYLGGVLANMLPTADLRQTFGLFAMLVALRMATSPR